MNKLLFLLIVAFLPSQFAVGMSDTIRNMEFEIVDTSDHLGAFQLIQPSSCGGIFYLGDSVVCSAQLVGNQLEIDTILFKGGQLFLSIYSDQRTGELLVGGMRAVYSSFDCGKNWDTIAVPLLDDFERVSAISVNSEGTVFISSFWKAICSTSNRIDWECGGCAGSFLFTGNIDANPLGEVLIACDAVPQAYLSSNGSCELVSKLDGYSDHEPSFAHFPNSNHMVMYMFDGWIYESFDRGENWDRRKLNMSELVVSQVNTNLFIIGASFSQEGIKVALSFDHFKTMIAIESQDYPRNVESICVDNQGFIWFTGSTSDGTKLLMRSKSTVLDVVAIGTDAIEDQCEFTMSNEAIAIRLTRSGPARVCLYSLSGRKIVEKSFSSSIEFESHLLSPGAYIVVVDHLDGGTVATRKYFKD